MLNPYVNQSSKSTEEIAIEYAPVVKHIALKLSARLPSNIELDDLIQAGMIGLLESIDRFDPKKGVKFKTFAEIRVRGAMLDELRDRDWIPRSVRENCTKLEGAYTELRAQNIDHPTDKQLAKQLDIKPKELPDFLNKSKPIPLLSLENLGKQGDSYSQLDILDTISDPEEESPAEKLLGSEAKELVMEALTKLPEKEKLVLSLYFVEDMNLKEIGAILDVSESRVSQMRTKAIAMLRSYMKSYISE
ncbi:FliA/WhiG family RNA polymerase sigma factor [bacterium]|nr:FliA/WhiG family RNA polymerase sigma factor [bacterium]